MSLFSNVSDILGLSKKIDKKLDTVLQEVEGLRQSQASDMNTMELALQDVNSILQKILVAVTPLSVASVDILFQGGNPIGENNMQLTDIQSVTFSLVPKDVKGAPASVDPTKSQASTDNPAVATVSMNADGLSGVVTAVGVGTCQLTGSVTDATDAADTVLFTPQTITVIGSEVKTVDVNFGTPQ